jgi:uncharacterized sulfatase
MENPTNTNSPSQPNIVLITVDQMRFPMHLPPRKLSDPADKLTINEFLDKYMHQLYTHLWQPGVKFSNFYTAASDCTAARATIHTGLYAYQTYSMLTLISYPPEEPTQPVLQKEFPTIGHLMREAGYETPYFGKWHLSYDVSDLEEYGYTSFTPNQDYVGYAGQGQATDDTPAWEAAHWINDYVRNAKLNAVSNPGDPPKPFFLTLNFVNPHDKQWFWGAMEANDFYRVYAAVEQVNPGEVPPGPYIQISPQDQPPTIYPTDVDLAIPNYQPQGELNSKPSTQTLVKEVFQYQMGGIFEDYTKQQNYSPVTVPPGFGYAVAPAHSPNQADPNHKAVAPPAYWSRAVDSYVQILSMVDRSIGNFMNSLSEEVRQNTIFIFTSDHGEYGSSHGLQGKGGTVYEEGIRVPLIVRDSRSNGYAKQTGMVRNQLTSSVDLLRMIVTMGNGGEGWLTGKYQDLYGHRWNLMSILDSPGALGRPHALHSTDEFVPKPYNFNNSPLHVIGLIQADQQTGTNKRKLGVYTTWEPFPASPTQATVINPLAQTPMLMSNIEYYNATNEVLEKTSTPQEGQTANTLLFSTLLSTELQKPLPTEALRAAQTHAYTKLVEYMALVDELAKPKTQAAAAGSSSGDVRRLLARAWAF